MALRAPDALDDIVIYPDHQLVLDRPDRHRMPRVATTRKLTLLLADLNAVALALFISVILHKQLNPTDPVSRQTYFFLLLGSAPLWPVTFTSQSLYKARFVTRGVDEGWKVIKAIGAGFLGVGVLSILAKVTLARTWLVLALPLVILFVGIERSIARALFRRARTHGQMLRRVVIIGNNAEGRLVKEMLDDDPSHGYEVVGFADELLAHAGARDVDAAIGDASLVLDLVRAQGASGVIIAATAMDIGTSNRLIRAFVEHGVHVELSSTLCDIASDRLTIRPLGRFPMVYIEPIHRHGWRAVAKRTFDLVASIVLLVLVAPILAASMVAIKLTSPGPVFFRQRRVGRGGREFMVLKLRTMVVNAEELLDNVRHLNEAKGPIFKIKDDPRITPVGRFLRRTSIDELPQLINVVRGEMSLVGPRPALPREVEQWEPSLHNRLRVQPGITGMWQVKGRADAGGDYGQLDLYYVDNWTLFTDLVILFRTVPAVLSQRGAC